MKPLSLLGLSLFGILLFSCIASFPAAAASDEGKVLLQPYLQTPAEKMVKSIWRKEPEYQEYINFFGGLPSHHTGEADLNDDGVNEIIVRHMDDLYKFCDKDPYTCRAHIYMLKDGGAIEIARFMAGKDIIVSDHKTNGFHDILTQDKDQRLTTYVWDGVVYVKQ